MKSAIDTIHEITGLEKSTIQQSYKWVIHLVETINKQSPAPATTTEQGVVSAEEEDTAKIEADTVRNLELISNFCEHLKAEAEIEIPEEVILSFFNA